MSVFRKLFGGGGQEPDQFQVARSGQRPAWMRDGMEVLLCEGNADLDVVGESHYQDSIWQLAGGRRHPEERVHVDVQAAILVAETDNQYDANAVSVWVGGLK